VAQAASLEGRERNERKHTTLVKFSVALTGELAGRVELVRA
jgi:hypothetical protein